MIIKKIEIKNFRNIGFCEIEPDSGINVFYGGNANGKTNILESVWMLTGFKSFRTANEEKLIKLGCKKALVTAVFDDGRRENTATTEITDKRRFEINSVPASAAGMIGKLSEVVFTPQNLSMIKNGPSERRRFTDSAICALKPSYARAVIEYDRILKQRNALLRDVKTRRSLMPLLETLDTSLSVAAAEIYTRRKAYLELLTPEVNEIYSGLSGGREEISLSYTGKTGESAGEYEAVFAGRRQEDIMSGSTSAGPHRDDLDIKINGLTARVYASQGQQRSCALALKLAEASVTEKLTSVKPVILLDDVMSELDALRQDYILNHIENRQVFITCCDKDQALRLGAGRIFYVENGVIKREESE